MRTPQRNDHLPPVLAGIVNQFSPKVPAKKPPCRCEAYDFPHRFGKRCEELAADIEYVVGPTAGGPRGCADDDIINADNASRGRDCRLASRGR